MYMLCMFNAVHTIRDVPRFRRVVVKERDFKSLKLSDL